MKKMKRKIETIRNNARTCGKCLFAVSLPAFVLVVGLSVQAAGQSYGFRGIAAIKEEFGLVFPIRGGVSGQVDFQLYTQSDDVKVNANPFRYVQYIHIRPYLHYNGFKNIQVSFSPSYMRRFAIPSFGTGASDEFRLTGMATFTQPQRFGSVYEQARVELRNTRDDAGSWSHVPRFRFRFGQNFDLAKESIKKHRIAAYEEILFKYRKGSKAFDSVQLYIGYGFNPRPDVMMSAGFLTQMQLKSSGRDFDFYFGPSVSVRYTLGKRKTDLPPPEPNAEN